jgi:hypothetical protein
MANISLSQVRDLWKRVSDWISGATADKPGVTVYGSDDGGTTRRVVKTDADGNIIISPGLGTEATLAAVKAVLDSLDGKVATDAKLEAARALLASLDGKVATDAKLEAARALLASLDGKDYATQTTLAAVLAKLADPATATKQDDATAVLDAISTAVAARATEATLAQIKTALTDGTQQVQLTGTLTELFGASLSDRPPASSVSVGATFMVVGTDIVYQSNGTDWVVIS